MDVIVGIDEVGRGCWAGPLVAAAVILSQGIPGLKDSKKLSKSQREKLAEIIQKEAIAIGLGWVSPQAIDSGGITEAVKSAMGAALNQITAPYDKVIIDGNYNYLKNYRVPPCRIATLVGADDLVPSVSAASIVAKVARDNFMAEAARKYPQYGFEKHVGYGTLQHREALRAHGITVLHRLSFKPIKGSVG
jgi:ribonuclease HII